ncbi:hypothetical protein DAPPUDRAFT_271046 [Daphnia pulex]|uniref:Uncharacterized protein n=1 Tax=Daphnia pulex TaxID=6669 RepID=E9I1P4_DAPPU|nr:hypothetical protein DAPPUDRAFT_271046 [Daphnia pulex]|eukprot:EFX62086.1 hypothetical protein DAPPUDRAFT_271046 [Daphnia pulex]
MLPDYTTCSRCGEVGSLGWGPNREHLLTISAEIVIAEGPKHQLVKDERGAPRWPRGKLEQIFRIGPNI